MSEDIDQDSLRIGLIAITSLLTATFAFAAQPASPTLGNYPNKMVGVRGNGTITPDAAPTGATSINVSTNSSFKALSLLIQEQAWYA